MIKGKTVEKGNDAVKPCCSRWDPSLLPIDVILRVVALLPMVAAGLSAEYKRGPDTTSSVGVLTFGKEGIGLF